MLTFIVIISIFAVIGLLLYFMAIRIKLLTMRRNEDDIVVIKVKTLYGLVNVKFEIPLLDIVLVNNKPALKYKAEIESNKTSKLWKRLSKIFTIDDFNNIKKYFHHDPVFLEMMKNYWFAKLSIHEFTFVLKYGLSDAALAAIIYGFVWTIMGTVLAFAKNNLSFNIKDVAITPYFDREAFSIEVSCIFKFKFGDIINTGIMLFKRRIQRRKIKQELKDPLNVS